MRTNRLLLAMTFTALFMFGTSLYGQQDVDPTWYNPFPDAARTDVPSQTAKQANRKQAVAALPDRQLTKLSAKHNTGLQGAARTAEAHATSVSRSPRSNGLTSAAAPRGWQRMNAGNLSDETDSVPSRSMADEATTPVAMKTPYLSDPASQANR